MKSTFKIKELDCANCATQLENSIRKIEGIQMVCINFMTEKMVLEYDNDNKEEIIKKVKKTIKKEEPNVKIEEI
ncbi:MAG: heavy metal transporter [Clostridia bacterium]|nr:heavy metal transporter [Clostridia bacterium]